MNDNVEYIQPWVEVRNYFRKYIGLRDQRHYDLLTAFTFATYIQDKFHHENYYNFGPLEPNSDP